MTKILFSVLLFFILGFWQGTYASYQTIFPDTPATDICQMHNPEFENEFISGLRYGMTSNYGNVAKDSIEAICIRAGNMFLSKTFFIPSTMGTWKPETISLADKLQSLLVDCKTPTDSIEKICHWIASRYPFGDPDANPNFANRSIDSTWHLMNKGNISGLCGEFSSFFSRIVESYFPHWGVPVQFGSEADTILTQGGKGLPSHIWVGLAKENGEIYAVCDPTIGGIVKDGPTGKMLYLKDVLNFLRNPESVQRPYIQTTTSSFQTYGADCVPAIMLLDTENPIYYNTPIEIVEAHWRGLENSSNQCVPYWHKKGLSRATFMNVYLDIRNIWCLEGTYDIAPKVRPIYLSDN